MTDDRPTTPNYTEEELRRRDAVELANNLPRASLGGFDPFKEYMNAAKAIEEFIRVGATPVAAPSSSAA